MSTPNRRDLFKYFAGTVLTSSLPAFGQNPKAWADKPLAIDVLGPMAFTMGGSAVDVWFPALTQKHEAGITTSVGTVDLGVGDHMIALSSASSPAPPTPTIYTTNGCTIHSEQGDWKKFAKNIHLTLPMPNNIVALNPVRARIYNQTFPGSTEPPACTPSKPKCALYALGLRLLYDKTGSPTLTGHGTSQPIPLDVADGEYQVTMAIGYEPTDPRDDDLEHNARKAFNELSKSLQSRSVDLHVEFDSTNCPCQPDRSSQRAEGSAHHPCKAPMILVKPAS